MEASKISTFLYPIPLSRKWVTNGLLLALLSILNISCLGGDASPEVENNSFGLRLVVISGNNQIGAPDELFEDPAVVQVVDSSGAGVEGININFSEIGGPYLFITSTTSKSNSNGIAQTSVRSPVEFDTTGQMQACIEGSNTCVSFEFGSNNTSDNIKFQLITENSGVETAGQPFSVQVRTVDAESLELVRYDGTLNLEWTFITEDSWAGISPTLLPAFLTCTFVEGICDVAQNVTLTDARVPTRVFLGDGDAGFIDIFGQQITVNADVPSQVVVTDASGGPGAGASTIADTVFTADDPDLTVFAAITDAVGNYISDASSVTWSSSHATEITANLSTLSGTSTSLDFYQSIPFPNVGYIFATVAGYPTGSSGQISIDPGTPVNAQVVPVDGNYTRVGGEEFAFDVHILDANGNIFGQQFGSTGYTGTFPVTLTFSNYVTAPIPTGGAIPMIHDSGTKERTDVSRTLSIPFFGGRAQFLSKRITFFDATSVNPQVTASVDASSEMSLPDVSGSVTYSMTVGPADHLMLRDGLGAGANTLCEADYTTVPYFWSDMDNILLADYQSTQKDVCSGLEVQSGATPFNVYLSVEDKGGNFIANLSGDWIYTDIANPDSFLASQFSGPATSNSQSFTPDRATGGDPNREWIRVQGTYLGTPYDQYFRGSVTPGTLHSIELRVLTADYKPFNEVRATDTNTLVVVPKDEQGNDLTESFYRDLNVTVGGTFNSAPDGQTPSFLSDGLYPNVLFQRVLPVDDRDSIGDYTAVGRFMNLITPNAGDVVTITVTDNDDPTITDSINWRVIPGNISRAEIWRDAPPPTGTEVTGTAFSITTDESTDLYAVAKDSYGNPITVNSSWVTWDDSPQPFAPSDAISGLISGTIQTPFNPDRPGTGRVRLALDGNNQGSATASTGIITINPGAPSRIQVDIDQETFPAGSSRTVTASVRDAKDNIVTTINGPTDLAITVLNNSLTRLNFSEVAPTGGSYSFTNGEYTFSGGESFTFYNSSETPRIQISTTSGTPVVGQSNLLTITPQSFDHLALLSDNTQVSAGDINRYTVRVEDLYGNRLSSGPDSTKNVTFNITSSLGDEDIVASDLGASSISNYALPNQTTINGNLLNGAAYVDVRSTKSGTLTVGGTTTGIVGTNTEEPLIVLPLTTISDIRFKAGEAPTSPSTTISPLLPFSVELLDAFDNVITTNNSDVVELSLIGASQSFGGYSPVTAVNGESVFSGLTYTLADSFTIRAVLQSNNSLTVDAPMTVENGSVTRTVVVLPDQTFTEGTGALATAVTGVPFSGTATRTAGDSFNVDVHAVDSSYNTVDTYTGLVSLTSTDPYLEVTPASQNFTAGVATFNVRVRQQGAVHNITASTGFTDNPSTNYTVNYGTASQLVALLPNQNLLEGAPDLATAVDLLVPDQIAGTAFDVEVLALDDYYNHVDNYSHGDISLTLDTDPAAVPPSNATMAGGTVTFSVTNFLADSDQTVTPNTASGASLTGQTSEFYETKANIATQYIAILPGQTHNPGQAPGDYASAVTGTPTDQDTDSGFSVNLLAVDNYFNTRPDHTSAVSVATPNDPTDTEPAASNFAAGAVTFTINPVTAADNQSLTVTSSLAANTPATYNVKPGAPSRLIALFTDYQTLVEGNNLLTSAVADQTVQDRTSGETVNVRVYATDGKFNIVDDDSTTVSIAASTPNSSVSPASQTLSNGIADFTVETYLVGTNYHVTPSGGSYAQNNSTQYNVILGLGKKLLVILPNQVFAPGQATANDAASGLPFDQTQGSDFPFQATVYSTDDYYNPRTSDTDTVSISPSLAATVSGGNSQSLVGGQANFTLFHTSNGNANSIQATAAGFTSVTSKNYDVNAALVDPTLALSDPTTSNTTYIRQTTVATTIGNDSTANRWCVSETQSSRPSSGTNQRTACNGGAGSDNGWHTSRPSTVATSSAQGSKTFYIWTADDANNVSVNSVSDTITLDSVAPANPAALTLADQSTTNTSYTNSATVDLNVTLAGDTDEWCIIEQPFINSPPTNPTYNSGCVWVSPPGVFPYAHTLTNTGARTVYVFAKDIAQNVSLTYASASITYDNAAPQFPAGDDIIGVRGGTDTVADEWLGTTTAPTVEWQAATDDTPITYTLTIRDGGTPICGSPVSGISGTSYSFGACLTHGNTYTVDLVAEDSAEQSTAADNNGFSFTVDTVAPTAFTFSGVDGGGDSTLDAYLTSALNNPRLNWSDSTGEDGYSVFITNDAETVTVCGDDIAAADATTYQSFSGCTLSDHTDYKVRVVAFDDAGNQTEATNSPFSFQTSEGVDNFLVELVPASNPVAGAGFAVRLTARRANNETVSAYAGVKTINWTSTGASGTDVCSSGFNMNPEYASTSLNFSSGVATTTSTFRLKRVQTGRTISATEQDTGYNATGTSSSFDVTAASLHCVQVEDQAGGAGSAMASQNLSIDSSVQAFAAGYDSYGNYLADQSVTWTGNGVMQDKPYPVTGTSTTVVVTEAGSGQLIATGGTIDAVNFNVSAGNGLFSSSTSDANGNNHLATNNVNAVYHWNISNDSSSAWITNSGLSWYNEATSANRGARDDFPSKVHLVATNSGLDIIDESNNSLFLRFQSGSDYAIDSDLGNIVDVSALNGKIFLAMNDGASTGGLIIIDLANDQVYQTNSVARSLSSANIANRNNAGIWSANTTYPLLGSSRLNKIVVREIAGIDYAFLAESNGVDVLRVSGTTSLYRDPTTNPVNSVDVDSAGKLYYGEDSVGLHRADLSLPLATNFSPARTYTAATNAELTSLAINDLSIAEGAAGSGQNTILVASSLGLTAIDENATFGSSTSAAYTTLGSGENAFNGALSLLGTDGYVSVADGGGLTSTATIDMWFRPAGAPANTVLLQKGSAVDGSFELAFNGSGYLVFTVRHNGIDYSVTSSSNTWANNQWYYVAATISASDIALWVDGVDKQSNSSMDFSIPSPFAVSTADLEIGGTSGGGHFNGLIDEVRISDLDRYSAATLSIPNAAFFDDANTEHLFHFDASSGATANYADSGAQVNGTLTGDVYFVKPLYPGSQEAVSNLDSYYSGGRISTHIVNSSGWVEILDLQGSPYVNASDTSAACYDVKIYHKTSSTDHDIFLGRSTSGVQLRRR